MYITCVWEMIWLAMLTSCCLRRAFYRSWKNNDQLHNRQKMMRLAQEIFCVQSQPEPHQAPEFQSRRSSSGVGSSDLTSGQELQLVIQDMGSALNEMPTRVSQAWDRGAGGRAGRKSMVIKLSLVCSSQAQSTQRRYKWNLSRPEQEAKHEEAELKRAPRVLFLLSVPNFGDSAWWWAGEPGQKDNEKED